MILFKINNKKTIRWNYKRFIQNLIPILAILAWFAMYALVSHMEYGHMIAD